MNFSANSFWGLSLCLLAACQSDTGIRELDFARKQFAATYTINSPKGIDTMNLAGLMGLREIFKFKEGVKEQITFRWA